MLKLPKFNTIGEEEIQNVQRALAVTRLSGYIGGLHKGGYWVERLSHNWSEAFDVLYVMPCNSATSGLLAACIAAGVGPYDDVFVTNYSMSATAACALVLGADVTFIDIEPDHFGLDITKAPIEVRPKAVIVTNLFGHPAKLLEIRKWCDERGVIMIEDNAQAPFASCNGQYTGTIGHIGVFSLNVHKHIQCGEGGVVVTHDGALHERVQDACNHGELRVDLPDRRLVGLNLRMTETTAAIACAQLKKAKKIIAGRVDLALEITDMFRQIPEVIAPFTAAKCSHVYYVWAARIFSGYRDFLVRELNEHGFPIKAGYSTPLNKVFGTTGIFKETGTAEKELMTFEVCAYDPAPSDLKKMRDIVAYSGEVAVGRRRA